MEAACAVAEISRAAVAGDLDDDGDADLVVVNIAGPARVYRNEAEREGEPLVLDVRDGVRAAIGADVRVELAKETRRGTVSGGFGYLSSGDLRLRFGVAGESATSGATVTVRWGNRSSERFRLERASGEHVLRRGEGESLP